MVLRSLNFTVLIGNVVLYNWLNFYVTEELYGDSWQ